MKKRQKFLLVFSGLLLFSFAVRAQVDSLMLGIEETNEQLLPEKMGFIKRAFWGEHGLMRTLKISPLTPESRQKELRVRRTMLKMHQFLGIVTVAGMATSIYFGQKIKSGHYEYIDEMDTYGTLSAGLYGTTALLQLLAPPPLVIRKSKGWSSIRVHKTLAYFHFTGMIATAITGVSLGREGDYTKMTPHQVSAYFTTATLAGAMIVMTF